MKDINKIISGLSKSGVISGFAGGAVGGALGSAMMSKKGKKMGKGALKLGALAAVGGVAWKAYQAYSQKNMQQAQSNVQQSPQAAPQSQYIPSQPTQSFTYSPASLKQQQFEQVLEDESKDTGQMLLLRAMIAAANADGHIDEEERERIYQQVDQLELSTADKAGLFDELRNPMDLSQLVSTVPNAETAVEVYAASVLAIDEHAPASQTYLSRLATSLLIPKELVQSIHAQSQLA